MDGSRVDDVARGLASGGYSRRGAFRALLGGITGGLAGAIGFGTNAAAAPNVDCCPKSHPTRCGLTCMATAADPNNCGKCGRVCANGEICEDGKCVCPAGQRRCGGVCVDRQTNANHCGKCDKPCATGQLCQAGVCIAGCGTAADCPGSDTFCKTRTCTGGACGVSYAVANTRTPEQIGGDCKATVCDGSGNIITIIDNTDVPPDTNPCSVSLCLDGNPGGALLDPGSPCSGPSGGSVCDENGNCVECLVDGDCPAGSCCGGTCATTLGAACTTGRPGVCATGVLTCAGGLVVCQQSAQPSPEVCDGVDNDCDGVVDNGDICPPGQNTVNVCRNGQCVFNSCSAGYADCNGLAADGCETNILSDVNNCGACGKICSFPNVLATSCVNGVCAIATCFPPFRDCDGIAANGCEVNTAFDSRNCGGCGTICLNGSQCVNVRCIGG